MSLRPDLVECWVFRVRERGRPVDGGAAAGADAGADGTATDKATDGADAEARSGVDAVAGEAADAGPDVGGIRPRPGPEILLMRRAPGRIFAGLWQCVTGGIEPGERVPLAALRELVEETGFGPAEIEAFFDLDQVAPFYDEGSDGVVVSAIFAVRVRPDAEPVLSHEHDAFRWMRASEAGPLAIWPSYAESIRRIEERLLDPAMAPWFEVTFDGRRVRR